MSKERAKRRAERLVVLEKEKAARARKTARLHKRQALSRKLTPRRKRTGTLHVFSRTEKTGIVLVPLVAIAAVWLFVPDVALRVVLIVLTVLVLPALVAIVLGRR